MPIGLNSSAIGAQLEKVKSTDLVDLFQLDKTLFTRIWARPMDSVSSRPERLPFKALSGGKSRVVNLDNGDMGLGGAPVEAFGSLSPVYFDHIIQWSKLAEQATNSKEKSVIDYAQWILKNAMDQFKSNLDSLLSYGDGANTLGVVTSYDNTNFIVFVDNANRFYDGQDIDDWSALGGTNRGTITILSVDANNKALYLSSALGFTPAAGDLLLENNSTGVAGSGLNGITNLQLNSNSGTYLGVTRANYPGKFSTPTVNAANNTLTPSLARLLINQMKIAMGVETDTSGLIAFMGLDQKAAWENTGLIVTQNIQSGNATGRDMLAKTQVETIGGIEIVASLKAIPGRIDLLDLNNWFRSEIQPLDWYDAGGQTTFWPMGSSGGIQASFIRYLVWGGQVGSMNPRRGAYLSNLAIPVGY